MADPFSFPHSPHSPHRQHHAKPRNQGADGRVKRHRMLVWVAAAVLLFVVAAPAVFYAHAHWTAAASEGSSRLTLESGTGTPPQPA